jgi:uncharacterized protein
MYLLQIDTISVVNRSPYLVLWSRIGAFENKWLEELLEEGALFEYWAHAACFLPIEDYGIYRHTMLNGVKNWRAWIQEHPEEHEKVLSYVRENGPTMARDFPRPDRKKSVWWDWKPEKIALECLFYTGELMIRKRERFQRVYDLQERVLPGWDDSSVPPEEEVRKIQAARSVKALGVALAPWAARYFYMPVVPMPALLKELVKAGELEEVEIEGWSETAYVHKDNLPLVEQACSGELRPEVTTLLSPFDPVASDRDRLSKLFGMDYLIETYTPVEKRKYGYFTLPILHRGAMVGRLDPKAHRKEGLFEVRALHLEPGVQVTDQLVNDLAATIQACADWHSTPEVIIRQSDPPELVGSLQAALRAG